MKYFVALAMASVLGCSDGTAPVGNAGAGTYDLLTVDGKSLPTLESETSTKTTTLVSGTLTLQSNLQFMQVLNYRDQLKSDGSTSTTQTVRNGTYFGTSGTISFTMPSYNGNSPPIVWGGSIGTTTIKFADPSTNRASEFRRQ